MDSPTAPEANVRAAQAVVNRLLPRLSPQIFLQIARSKDAHESFRISGKQGHINVRGTSSSALLFGVNWYLKYVAHLQVSTDGNYLAFQGDLPPPSEVIERNSTYRYRYALNENTDGYTTPYWDWPQWQRQIDIFALSGINNMLVETGTDLVLYETFRDFGYSDLEIRRWITQPAHQNWELMGNLCCFDEPVSKQLLTRRSQLARQMIARLRQLGITPVLPGYFGIVPPDFQEKHKRAHVVSQGEWNGFARPGWLDPTDPMFARIAASFYRHQRDLFGNTNLYDMETFQEGGTSGNVPVKEASHSIQAALLASHPDASWLLLGWQDNPSAELLEGVNKQRLLIVDIEQGRNPNHDRDKDFKGAPYLFGGLWDFGGRTTMGANLYDYGVRLPLVRKNSTALAGTAVFPEGINTDPYVFDLFTEMAWYSTPIDLQQWTREYAARRYGADDPHALLAWQILLRTAYGNRADGVMSHGERDAAQESLFNAQPSLTAVRASTWAPDSIRYSPEEFEQALVQLLQAAPALHATETYRYDLVNVTRQVLANRSRLWLPQIRVAYNEKNEPRFRLLADQWQHAMDLQDTLLSTSSFFMLGPWLEHVPSWASSEQEQTRLEYDARSILTTWGDRKASEAGLHDYGNKDWAGLTLDYYLLRWKLYFNSLDVALKSGDAPVPIDWFAVGDAWNRGRQTYTIRPRGDSYVVALRIAKELHLLKEDTKP